MEDDAGNRSHVQHHQRFTVDLTKPILDNSFRLTRPTLVLIILIDYPTKLAQKYNLPLTIKIELGAELTTKNWKKIIFQSMMTMYTLLHCLVGNCQMVLVICCEG